MQENKNEEYTGLGAYEAPRCEVIEVEVEAGFLASFPDAGHDGFGDGDDDGIW